MCVSWRARAAENGAAGREMRGGKGERGIPRERERESAIGRGRQSEYLHKLYNENKAFDKKGRPTTLAFRNSRLFEPLHDVTPVVPIPPKVLTITETRF